MKTSVFIFLFLLVSSLSSVMDSGAKSGVPAAAAVRQTAECFLAGFKYGDCVATETVRTAVPCPCGRCASRWKVRSGCRAATVTSAPGGISRWRRAAARNTSSLLYCAAGRPPAFPSRRLPPVRRSGHLAVKSFRFQAYDAVRASYVGFPCADSGLSHRRRCGERRSACFAACAECSGTPDGKL